MISSESSDDEFEQLKQIQKPEVARKKKQPVLQEEKASVEPPKDLKSKSRAEDGLTKEERRVLKKQRRQEERRLIATQLEKKRIEDEERTRKEKGRAYTLSIAIPGSIIDNAQTKELKTYLAGQVARAAVIFQVDEIIVFDDQLGNSKGEIKKKDDDCHIFMNRILQYLETPQYLRKALFPMHPDLKYAGLLNPLDCPHHIKSNEASVYREGVVTDRPLKENEGSHVYVGLQKDVIIDKLLQPGVRVTVKIDEESLSKKKVKGTAVSPAEPREQLGIYWGYTSRYANSLSQVWKDCPFKGGYDLKIGTSERGSVTVDDPKFTLPSFRHVLVVFGGVAGIEECVNADETIPVSGEDSHTLFDMWVNTCPAQGSRTIRSEEAILISLAAMRRQLTISGKK